VFIDGKVNQISMLYVRSAFYTDFFA